MRWAKNIRAQGGPCALFFILLRDVYWQALQIENKNARATPIMTHEAPMHLSTSSPTVCSNPHITIIDRTFALTITDLRFKIIVTPRLLCQL